MFRVPSLMGREPSRRHFTGTAGRSTARLIPQVRLIPLEVRNIVVAGSSMLQAVTIMEAEENPASQSPFA